MKIILIVIFCSVGLFPSAQNNRVFSIIRTYHIASPGGWDYLAINNGKLYVSHGSQVNILDEKTGDSLGVLRNTAGVHGIAFIAKTGKGYTSNGRSNDVMVFDLSNGKELNRIKTGDNPDAILFEPYSQKIITCNGRSKDLSVIDPVSEKVIATIPVNGKPEAAVSDGNGKLFVNNEDKNEIEVINTKTWKLEARWPLTPGEGPTGLAFDRKNKILFAGCDKLLIVMDARNGAVLNKLSIGDGCDGVAYDGENHLVFTSNGEGTLTVIKQKGRKFSVAGNYPTKKGARTITIDEKTGELFLPTAEFEKSTEQNGRPKMIPATFQVLVIK